MAISVKLEAFEGPLDLLLHLIEKNKVDIYDIPIVEITEQYMEYVRRLTAESEAVERVEDLGNEARERETLNTRTCDVMSEFLVMAATLLDIKCRMLLPAEVNEEGEEEDPRAELVQKLLEYKMYKYMSVELRDRQVDAAKTLYREQKLPEEVAAYKPPINYDELVEGMNLNKLHEIFRQVIRRQEDKMDPIRSQYGRIEKEEIDMEAKMLYVEAICMTNRSFSFRRLLEKQKSKAEIIVTFLIILELMKVGKISIRQEALFDDIVIESNVA